MLGVDPILLIVWPILMGLMAAPIQRKSHKKMAKHAYNKPTGPWHRRSKLLDMAIAEDLATSGHRRHRAPRPSSRHGFENGNDGTIHATDDLDLNDWLH